MRSPPQQERFFVTRITVPVLSEGRRMDVRECDDHRAINIEFSARGRRPCSGNGDAHRHRSDNPLSYEPSRFSETRTPAAHAMQDNGTPSRVTSCPTFASIPFLPWDQNTKIVASAFLSTLSPLVLRLYRYSVCTRRHRRYSRSGKPCPQPLFFFRDVDGCQFNSCQKWVTIRKPKVVNVFDSNPEASTYMPHLLRSAIRPLSEFFGFGD